MVGREQERRKKNTIMFGLHVKSKHTSHIVHSQIINANITWRRARNENYIRTCEYILFAAGVLFAHLLVISAELLFAVITVPFTYIYAWERMELPIRLGDFE